MKESRGRNSEPEIDEVRQRERQTDRQSDRQTDRQTE